MSQTNDPNYPREDTLPLLTGISAVALAANDMAESVSFYRALGFELTYGGETERFSTLRCGASFLNLVERPQSKPHEWWGRIIFHVADVDDMYRRALSRNFPTETKPRDAEWGERYFHMLDPAGHQLSFAMPLT